MQLNMISIDRSPRPNYIHGTLESLRASDWNSAEMPLTICVGDERQDYVEGLGCNVLPWDGPDFETRWVSFVDNYVRALRHGDGDLIICEDDILFMPRWVERLKEGVTEIAQKKSRFILALYAAREPGERGWFRRGKHFRRYLAPRFYGTQAMFFSASVRDEVADYLESNRRRRPGDLLIGEWCHQRPNRILYALQGSIVQHVGSVSTGLGSGEHRAWKLLQ